MTNSANGSADSTRGTNGGDASGAYARTPAIDLAEVRHSYPDGHESLRGVTLRIEAGERVAVLGPNGAGKSTLCLQLNGILTPTAGTVSVCGLPVQKKNLQEVRRCVGVVFQDPDDMLFMPTVEGDVAFGPSNLGLTEDGIQAKVDHALGAVGMQGMGGRSPHHLSFGQRKRVAAATVLSMDPQVLVLDEPASNLDPRSRREFGEILAELEQTIVMVTHDLPYAFELCERAVIIDRGCIVADGPTDEILGDAALLAEHDLELPRGFTLAPYHD